MSLSSILPHNPKNDPKMGYLQVKMREEGPTIHIKNLEDLAGHSCLEDLDFFFNSLVINSTVMVGAGNHYREGLIISPFPKCRHYKTLIVSTSKNKFQSLKSHDDLIVVIIILPTEFLYPTIPYIDLEMELKALIQQDYDEQNEYALSETVIDYIKWRYR